MPKNVMKLLKPSPHRARNDFDLSHRHVYTANFGELLPSTCIETVPGDHIVMHASNLLRAIPMVTSPFMRAKQHIDLWFVPYRDLWHNFDQFMVQKDQPVSSALKNSAFCPHVELKELWNTGCDSGYTDVVGRQQDYGAEKILNLLGYGDHFTSASSPKVNLFRLAAYNYIWYNEYRQKYYDDGSRLLATGANVASLFNFDDMDCGSQSSANLINKTNSAYLLRAMCQMRYRTWKKDLFTGLMPSTQFGAVSTVSSTLPANFILKNDATGLAAGDNIGVFNTAGNLAAYHSGSVVANSTSFSMSSQYNTNNPSIDVLSLRRSEAIQIWRENALRAGNRVSDNMRAHYGVESDFRDHRPTYLGSVSAPLNIGDVMATANSTTGVNNSVGDIAGKGLSSLDEKVFTFDSKDFGVIIAIHSLLAEAEYNASGIDRCNQLLESEDFFIPEYENLGLEAVSSSTFVAVPPSISLVIGYAPRYYAYKTKMDKCFGTFMTGGINAPWCTPKYDVASALLSPSVMPLECLYVNPKLFDVNFSVGLSVQDQFLCDVYYDVDAVRPMSVVGLPFS